MSLRPVKRIIQAQPTIEGAGVKLRRALSFGSTSDFDPFLLLVSGKPLEEPVAWYGPIVMNTEEQLRRAFAELHNGTFIKER